MKLRYLKSILQSRSSMLPSYCRNRKMRFVICKLFRIATDGGRCSMLDGPSKDGPLVQARTEFLSFQIASMLFHLYNCTCGLQHYPLPTYMRQTVMPPCGLTSKIWLLEVNKKIN